MEDFNRKKESILKKTLPWIMIILFGIFAYCGIYIALICIYALPDGNVKPLEGSIFFASASAIILSVVYYLSVKEKSDLYKRIGEKESVETTVILKENLSDTILKWIITLCAVIFILFSLMLPLICVYALPDRTVQPFAGLLYFLCSALVLTALIITRKKSVKLP